MMISYIKGLMYYRVMQIIEGVRLILNSYEVNSRAINSREIDLTLCHEINSHMINSIYGWDILNLPIDLFTIQIQPGILDDLCLALISNGTRTNMPCS